MKIDVATARDGGPFRWGRDLVYALSVERGVAANHIHTLTTIMSRIGCDVDAIHSTIPNPPRLRRTPLILTVQGDYTMESVLWRSLYRRAIEEAVIVTTPSWLLKQKLGLDKAVVIPNAVFPDRFNGSVSREKENGKVKAITVSNFHFPDKAAGVLAIAKLLSKTQAHEIEYTVVGDGKYKKAIEREAAHWTVKPHFAGFVPDVRPLLAESDIFLYYSDHDTFPIAILEAMASGLPVITNNIGATPEMIDNERDGYVAQDEAAYLGYLASLLACKELRETVGANARSKVVERFNWHRAVDDFINLYGTVL